MTNTISCKLLVDKKFYDFDKIFEYEKHYRQ